MLIDASPDGRYEVLAKSDKTILLRHRETGRTVDLTDFEITRVSFSPNSHHLAANGANATVFLFNTGTEVPMGVLKGHKSDVRSVAFSPNGRWLATVSRDGVVKVWDVPPEQKRRQTVSLPGGEHSLRFSPDGRLLAIASGRWQSADGVRGQVLVWDWKNSSIVARYESDAPVGVAAFVDANSLVAADWRGQATHWDFRRNIHLKKVSIEKNLVSLAEFSPCNGQALVAAALAAPPAVETVSERAVLSQLGDWSPTWLNSNSVGNDLK